MELICTYWGSDSGNRVFDIIVDGGTVVTQRLNTPAAGRFLDITYPIPLELTHGKETICVRFQAHPGMMAGGVFGIRTVMSDLP